MAFLFILYKLQVMTAFLSSTQHYDIIASGVIFNPNILYEGIALSPIIAFRHIFDKINRMKNYIVRHNKEVLSFHFRYYTAGFYKIRTVLFNLK